MKKLVYVLTSFIGYPNAEIISICATSKELCIVGKVSGKELIIFTQSPHLIHAWWKDEHGEDIKFTELMAAGISSADMEKHLPIVQAIRELMTGEKPKIVNWTYVVEFSCMVERLKDLDHSRILKCSRHPKIPGDALVTMSITNPEEILGYLLHVKTYSDNRRKSDKTCGGLHIWHVTNIDSFTGENECSSIRAEYNC